MERLMLLNVLKDAGTKPCNDSYQNVTNAVSYSVKMLKNSTVLTARRRVTWLVEGGGVGGGGMGMKLGKMQGAGDTVGQVRKSCRSLVLTLGSGISQLLFPIIHALILTNMK